MDKRIILAVMLLAGTVSAQQWTSDNSTKTPAYLQLDGNNPGGAIITAYTEILGPWFWLLLIMGPFFMMYIYQGNRLSIPSIWLLTTLAAYEYLIAGMVQDIVFYFCIVVWVATIILKLTGPVFQEV